VELVALAAYQLMLEIAAGVPQSMNPFSYTVYAPVRAAAEEIRGGFMLYDQCLLKSITRKESYCIAAENEATAPVVSGSKMTPMGGKENPELYVSWGMNSKVISSTL